jgi:hypothetical protein
MLLVFFYSILGLIIFMIFGESRKLESSSMRCFFSPMLLPRHQYKHSCLHLLIHNASKLCFSHLWKVNCRTIPRGCVKRMEDVRLFVVCLHYYSFFAQKSRTHKKVPAEYCWLQRPIPICHTYNWNKKTTMARNALSRALSCAVCKWMDDKLRASVNDALSSVCTFHRNQVNTHVFEVIEYVFFFIVAPCISISIFQGKPTNALISSVFKNTH